MFFLFFLKLHPEFTNSKFKVPNSIHIVKEERVVLSFIAVVETFLYFSLVDIKFRIFCVFLMNGIRAERSSYSYEDSILTNGRTSFLHRPSCEQVFLGLSLVRNICFF